ncbi:hypothetical protein [Streptomyces sp. NPDC059649]|uniref:hypothetical protein n=1 Tax=Streptomyces sp. NPDC059649 TaxID=3346895 RepID=UPI0036BEAD8D
MRPFADLYADFNACAGSLVHATTVTVDASNLPTTRVLSAHPVWEIVDGQCRDPASLLGSAE